MTGSAVRGSYLAENPSFQSLSEYVHHHVPGRRDQNIGEHVFQGRLGIVAKEHLLETRGRRPLTTYSFARNDLLHLLRRLFFVGFRRYSRVLTVAREVFHVYLDARE